MVVGKDHPFRVRDPPSHDRRSRSQLILILRQLGVHDGQARLVLAKGPTTQVACRTGRCDSLSPTGKAEAAWR